MPVSGDRVLGGADRPAGVRGWAGQPSATSGAASSAQRRDSTASRVPGLAGVPAGPLTGMRIQSAATTPPRAVAVSGVIAIASWSPKTSTAGSTPVTYEESLAVRASKARPPPTTMGPTPICSRGLIRPAKLPDRAERRGITSVSGRNCLLYTSDAADEEDSVDLGGRRI